MKRTKIPHLLPTLALAMAVAIPQLGRAVPYASSVTESAGDVSFYLNENADSVQVVFSGPSSTLDLGPQTKGQKTFSRGAAASYQIKVTKSAPNTWTQISDDNNTFVQFYAPRSVAVNQNPKTATFGRVYVLEQANSTGGGTTGSGRTISKGIYGLNPDLSDAVGQGNSGLTGGLDALDIFAPTANSVYEPWKLFVGDDGYVYISDAQDPRGALARVDANMANGELVLAGVGNATRPDLHTVVYGINVKGSLSAGTLSVVGIDGQWSAGNNSVLRWNIGSGPLPSETAPTLLFNAGLSASEQSSDIDIAPDGKIFVHFYRSTFASTGPSVQVFDPSGTRLWSSISGGVDSFLNTRSLKVSPDGTKLAVFRSDQKTVIVALTNGIPDMSKTNLLATFATTASHTSRSVTWDLAGNLYVANNNAERLHVWSPGGTFTAITGSDGTFSMTQPATSVSITNTVASRYENDSTPVVFTLTRAGNTADPLTVNLAVSGTAISGVDYTPAIPSSITFAAGAVSTNITVTLVNNSVADFTKTLIVGVGGSTNYSQGTPGNFSFSILDEDSPVLSLELAQSDNRLLESYSQSSVALQVVRRGLLNTNLTANISYSGAPAQGVRFNGPTTVSLGNNAVNAAFKITPINDDIYQGNQDLTVSAAAGSGYTVAEANSAVATLVDDDYPAGTVLFSDNFETDSSSQWIINTTTGDSAAEFAFDYSSVFVPNAPGGNTSKGLRFRLNEIAGADRAAISASPVIQIDPQSDFRVKFQMWINYNGPMVNGGAGSTYHLSTGIGTTPDHANLTTSGASDGIWFNVDGDGGSTFAEGDINAYVATDLQSDESGIYAAGTTDNPRSTGNSFYSIWGGITAPTAQLANFSGQTGTSQVGNMGVSWHTVVITKATNVVTWAIDGIPIASVPANATALSSNVFVGYMDLFPGASGVPAMSFGVIDNFRIETFSATPPAAVNITGIQVVGGTVQVSFTGSVADSTSSFTLQSAADVAGAYADESATISSSSAGVFQATIPVNGATRFYRIKR